MSSPASATSMLDKLLARSAALQQKLDSMTTSQPRGARAGKVREAVEISGPSAMLDRCLTRTHALHGKVDKLSTDMAASRQISNLETTLPRTMPGFQDATKQHGEFLANTTDSIVDSTVKIKPLDAPASCENFVADCEVMDVDVASSLFDRQTMENYKSGVQQTWAGWDSSSGQEVIQQQAAPRSRELFGSKTSAMPAAPEESKFLATSIGSNGSMGPSGMVRSLAISTGSKTSADRFAASDLETTTSPTIPRSETPARATSGLVAMEVHTAEARTKPDHQDLLVATKSSTISRTPLSDHPAVTRTVSS